jgi:hypothetical protein
VGPDRRDQRLYARSLARELGYVHPDDHAETVKALTGALEDNTALQAELDQLRRSSTRLTCSHRRDSQHVRSRDARPKQGEGLMEWQALGQVAGTTHKYVVIDSERDLGFTIEGTLEVKVPKGGGKPGAALEVRFVAGHVYPLDPLWDGHGESPAKIKADAKAALEEQLEEAAAARRAEQEKAAGESAA